MTYPRDDQSPAPAEITDSDIEEEEDPDEEEEVVEEDEDEEEEEEMEEEEDDNQDSLEVEMDIPDSPIHDQNHRQDVRKDIEYEARSPSNTHATEGCSVAGEGIANAIPISDHLSKEVKNGTHREDDMKQVNEKPRNDRKRMDSRSAASEIEATIMSRGDSSSDQNKRPAIICDFFGKGWCIRGTSCNFVHMKDNPNSSHPQPEGDIAAASFTREAQLDEGLRDIIERPRSSGFPEPLASSSGSSFAFSSHLSSEKIVLPKHMGMQKQHQFHEKNVLPSVQGEETNIGDSTDAWKLYPSKDDLCFLSSLKAIGREDQTRKWSTDGYNNFPINKGDPVFKKGLHPEPGSVVSSGKYYIENHSSCLSSVGGPPSRIWNHLMHHDHASPLVSLSLNSSSSNLLTDGLFPSSRISSSTGFSTSSSYSYLDARHLGTQKLLHRGRDYHSSTRSSPLKKISSTSVPLRSSGLNTKISSDDWEPSVPFRPSLFIPPASISSSGNQYDPLRDSIELPKLANISFKASFHSDGKTNGNRLHQQIHGESVSGTQRPACDGDTKSMSSHNTYHEKVLDNSCFTGQQNSPANEAETVGTSVVGQNGTMTTKEKPLSSSHLKGSTNPNNTNLYGDSRHKNDIKIGRFRENNEVDGEHLTDGDVQQEQRVRVFHATLVDFVKDLLKPKWREGGLSKDAHNLIVKKAVEKVIGAFQPHQIPPTVETSVQYLSTSRSKITKLVEGYVEKYGKS